MGDPKNVISCLKEQTFTDFEVLIASEKGIVNAMNKALERARGEIFIRVDDDVYIPPRWLEEIVRPFSVPFVAGATGPTFVPMDRRKNRDSIRIWERPNWFLRWLADNDPFSPARIYKCGSVSYGSNYEEKFKKPYKYYGLSADHLEGTNWAMRTELIKEVGGFDPKFDGVAEWFDTDVEQKVKKLGYRLVYNPRAYLWHLLEFSPSYNDRFDASGRIKNWLRFHKRHSKFHWKMVVFLIVWVSYFIQKKVERCVKSR
jgi:GT2 family glycosyltransferase